LEKQKFYPLRINKNEKNGLVLEGGKHHLAFILLLPYRENSLGAEEVRENRAMSKKDSPGLNIMELIIAMGIVGILLAVASPLVAQFSSGYRIRAAAREVATDLQFARLLAVKENKDFQVAFNSSSYQVVRVSDGLVAKSRSFSIDYPEITLSTLAVPEITLSAFAVPFNSRGNSSPRTIVVSNPMRTKNITVGSTGRVKLE